MCSLHCKPHQHKDGEPSASAGTPSASQTVNTAAQTANTSDETLRLDILIRGRPSWKILWLNRSNKVGLLSDSVYKEEKYTFRFTAALRINCSYEVLFFAINLKHMKLYRNAFLEKNLKKAFSPIAGILSNSNSPLISCLNLNFVFLCFLH